MHSLMRNTGRMAIALVLAASLEVRPAGQTITATLQGVVRDVSRAVLPGAAVTLRDQNTGYVRSSITDGTGVYVVTYVPAGVYTLTIELAGFKTFRLEDLRFEVGQEMTLDAALELVGVTENVTVTQTAPLVETTSSTVDQVINREQIDNLPLPGRQATQLALLAPGVISRTTSTGISTEEPVGGSGQPRGSGETLVDGVSTELMATNSVRSSAPPDAIEEFQVLTNQYQAEFGNASGVILNTITRSGTNELHGRGYYFHRDEGLDARKAFTTTKATFEQKQGGGWFGGPIMLDRTHFFVAYEATRRLQIATVTSPVAPGDVDQPYDNNQLLAKVTHQFNANHRLNGRFSLDRPDQENLTVGGFALEEVGIHQLNEDLSYQGNLASVLSNRALNEFRLQIADYNVRLDTKNPDAFTINRPSSTSGKQPNVPQGFPELRVQLVDNFSYELGAHRLKFGVDFNHVNLEGFVYQNIPGTFTFSTDRPFDPADLTTYPTTFAGNEGDPNFKFTSTGVALFAQDAWHLPRNVTLNLGLRYDAWDVEGLDLQKGNVAPRLGVAWDPFGTNKTAIRGGYGIFYNNILTNATLFTTFLSSQRSVLIVNPGYPDPLSRGTTTRPPLSTYIAEPDQPLPRAYQATLGFQRELLARLSVGADYVNARGRKLMRLVDTNPVTPPTFTRPDPTRGFVRIVEGTGYSNYHGLLVNAKGRLSDRAVLQVAYTISSYKTTTDAENAVTQQDDLNKNDSYGYGQFDQRQRAVIGAYGTLPWQIQVGGVLTARSGVPFNITTGRDNNSNGVSNDRPDLAAGAEVNTSDMNNRASFVDPGARSGNLPRNAGRGPSYWTLDARLARRFPLGRTSIEGLIEAFNLTNRVNYNNMVGNLGSPLFGQPNTAFDARQVQLGVRFEF